MKALEIGPGRCPVSSEWDILDVPRPRWRLKKRPGQRFFKGVWGKSKLPFEDCTYDFIFASHVLEHVPWFQSIDALKEALRILKPGGSIEIWVPDFAVIVEAYLAHKCGDKWRKYNSDHDYMTWVNGRLFTYGPGEVWHHACFDAYRLRYCLERAGFANIQQLTERKCGKTHANIELGMQGERPA